MSVNPSRTTVSIARTQTEINQALAFCGSVYEKNYGTHWTVPSDLTFVAREKGYIVATGGLSFAALHTQMTSERYFRLTQGMRQFIETNRERICEFGRFASVKTLAAKAILSSAVSYCAQAEIDFIFSWATPTVSKYTCNQLGLNVWPIAVPLDLENALKDPRWSSPPVGFFQQEQPPMLHLGVVPFWANAAEILAAQSGIAADVTPWQIAASPETRVAAMKPTSFPLSSPRLLRSEDAASRSASARSSTVPSAPPTVEPGTLPVQRPKAG
jgi:hypothetical protein